ncbi:MAG: sigma-54 dependent transcriptional regulator [bacterium]
MHTILIADDEPNIRKSLGRVLSLEGYKVVNATNGREALDLVRTRAVDLILLDVLMPEMDGLAALGALRAELPELPVVMMSGNASIESAVQATKLGALDFLEKPLSTDKLLITVSNALRFARLSREHAELAQQVRDEGAMIGASPRMRAISEMIRKIAPSQGRVLITGANGTGKELVARAIHQQSTRSEGPFVKLNCAAIPAELIESELFGHEKGAFTGAVRMRRGKFELADTGTLFLDEIGDMSLSAQAKVLRVLQESELERVGGTETLQVDVRVVAATNKDLLAEIDRSSFREDLYYRLAVVPIELPLLSERKEDIAALSRHFLRLVCRQNGFREMTVSEEAIGLLMQRSWPGNVRELRNVIERLAILSTDSEITAELVQQILPSASAPRRERQAEGLSLKEHLALAERQLLVGTLSDHGGSVAATARALGLERSHLYKKMRAFGITPGTGKPEDED